MKKLFLVLMFGFVVSPLILYASSAVHHVDIALSGSGKPIAGAPVRVCNEPLTQVTPCLPKATIYSDVGLGIVKPNPFTADVLGNFDFYYDSSSGKKVAIQVSCQAGIPGCGPQGAVSTSRDVCVFCGETMQVDDIFVATQPIFDFIAGPGIQLSGSDDPANNRAKLSITVIGGDDPDGGLLHRILSPTHIDTIPYPPFMFGPEFGDIIRGNWNSHLWERLGAAQLGQVLTLVESNANPLESRPIPTWQWPDSLNTCTSVQVNGVEVGCEHEINFLDSSTTSGDGTTSDVTYIVTDDSDNGKTDVQVVVTTTVGGGVSVAACDPNKLVDLYVDVAGNDTTGDGSFANPWLTIQKAWDDGVPANVDGTYVIHLKSPGTYLPPVAQNVTNLGAKLFYGYQFDETLCALTPPCSLVRITGDDPTNSEAYIISENFFVANDTGAVNVLGVPVTFEFLTFKNNNFALVAQDGGKLTLGGIAFIDNDVGIMLNPGSGAYIEQSQYVNDCTDLFPNCDNLRFYNTVAPLPSGQAVADYAIQANGAFFSDVCDSFAYDTGVFVGIYSNPGGAAFAVGIHAQENSKFNLSSSLFMDGVVGAASTGISNYGSQMALNKLTIDGADNGIYSAGGFVSAAPFIEFGNFDIKNAVVGVVMGGAGEIVDIPTYTTVTTDLTTQGAYSYFGPSLQLLSVLFTNLAGIATEGTKVYCLNCDKPVNQGAVCTTGGGMEGAEAHYIEGQWSCFRKDP